MTTPTLNEPRSGPCAPWITAADVLAMSYPEGFVPSDTTAATMASYASDVLYAMSGRQFTGECGPVTVRPISRPSDIDTRFGHRGIPAGYLSAQQVGTAFGVSAGGGAVNAYGVSSPPEIDLYAYPVTAVAQVKIDGAIIPSSEYRLQGRRTLVRLQQSASAPPTQRYGWPVSQRIDLPDSEPGTFSVTYYYGVPPPQSGKSAAQFLAAQLCLDAEGLDSALPQRITTLSRQGISVAVVDVMDFLAKGLMGIWQVDLFIETYNPWKAKNRPLVWSPDMGRSRRMPA